MKILITASLGSNFTGSYKKGVYYIILNDYIEWMKKFFKISGHI